MRQPKGAANSQEDPLEKDMMLLTENLANFIP